MILVNYRFSLKNNKDDRPKVEHKDGSICEMNFFGTVPHIQSGKVEFSTSHNKKELEVLGILKVNVSQTRAAQRQAIF
jgi:hypothetical protein